jgi:uncharacterized phage protein (TIGR02216 family)
MRAGICGLGLRPEQFWRLTPAELFLMLGMDSQSRPLNRSGLGNLMKRFPDTVKGEKDDEQ